MRRGGGVWMGQVEVRCGGGCEATCCGEREVG
jgi:hypothetical protein